MTPFTINNKNDCTAFGTDGANKFEKLVNTLGMNPEVKKVVDIAIDKLTTRF